MHGSFCSYSPTTINTKGIETMGMIKKETVVWIPFYGPSILALIPPPPQTKYQKIKPFNF